MVQQSVVKCILEDTFPPSTQKLLNLCQEQLAFLEVSLHHMCLLLDEFDLSLPMADPCSPQHLRFVPPKPLLHSLYA